MEPGKESIFLQLEHNNDAVDYDDDEVGEEDKR